MLGDGLEADGVPLDEFVIEPVVLDHQLQNAVEECRVAAGLHGQKQVAGASDRRDARIDDDDLRAELAGLPHVARGDRCALGDVRAADPNHVRFRDVGPGIRGPIDAERLLVARRRRSPCKVGRCNRYWRIFRHTRANLPIRYVFSVVRLAPLSTATDEVAVRRLNALNVFGDDSNRLVVFESS